jgi:hypothetical protein
MNADERHLRTSSRSATHCSGRSRRACSSLRPQPEPEDYPDGAETRIAQQRIHHAELPSCLDLPHMTRPLTQPGVSRAGWFT